jgi:hypothetical protein
VKKFFLIILSASAFLFITFGFFLKGSVRERKPVPVVGVSCSTNDFSGQLTNETIAYFEGRTIEAPLLAGEIPYTGVLGVTNEERWIEVDLSEQKLKAWEGNRLYLETPVSTGLSWWPTPTGEFRVWIKLRATKMEGGTGKYYYYLPNVPYVMYFENENIPGWKGYGLHGTYWHNDFGTPRSHGCVNLPTEVAEKLYYWIYPVLPAGKSVVRASADNQGSRIVIHE